MNKSRKQDFECSGHGAVSEKRGVDLQPNANNDDPRHSTSSEASSSRLGDHRGSEGRLGKCAHPTQGLL